MRRGNKWLTSISSANENRTPKIVVNAMALIERRLADLPKETMPISISAFNNAIAALPPQCRPSAHEQRRAFRDQIEALLDTYFLKLPPTLASSGFGILSENVNRRSLKGGRPRHISMDTLVLALADLYARTTSNKIETLPVSESSRFVNFMDSCLSPHYCDAHLASALGRRWKGIRKSVRLLPPAPAVPNEIGYGPNRYPTATCYTL